MSRQLVSSKEENERLSSQLQSGFNGFNSFKVKKAEEIKEMNEKMEDLLSKVHFRAITHTWK
jgi:D-mannonate dehydratase